MKRPIPKFASFRPKNLVRAQASDEEALRRGSPASNIELVASDLHSSRDHSLDSGKTHDKQRARNEEEKQDATSCPTEQSAGAQRETTEVFVIDTVGDPSNLTVGALHRYARSSYFLFGSGDVLGLSQEQTFDPWVCDKEALIFSNRVCGSSKKRDRSSLRSLHRDVTGESRIRPQASQLPNLDAELDFVTLCAARSTKKRRSPVISSPESGSSADDVMRYRSIEGKVRSNNKSIDRDLLYNDILSCSEDRMEKQSSSVVHQVAQTRRTELLRKIKADPADFGAWLALIKNQDDILGWSRTFGRMSLTSAERRSNADVKLSMYIKALESVSNQEGRETLTLGMMEQAAQLWASEKLILQWESVVKNNPASLKLWTKYLDFRQSNFSSFKYEEVQTAYSECLSLLNGALQNGGKTTSEKEQIHELRIYIMLRMTLLMREAGFSELALATWQALLEFEFFKPKHLANPEHRYGGNHHQISLSSFEEFWDSEVPRMGEDNYEGWASFCLKRGNAPQLRTENTEHVLDIKDTWKSWVASERRQSLRSREAAHAIDDVKTDDSYRMILFSDIQAFLVDCSSQISQQFLLKAFLVFCHLPTYQAAVPEVNLRLWKRDGYLCNDVLYSPDVMLPVRRVQESQQQLCHLSDVHRQEGGFSDSSLRRQALEFPILDYQVTLDSLFASQGAWFSPLDSWRLEHAGDQFPTRTAWIVRVVRSLVYGGVGGNSLAVLLLALELRFCPKTIEKTSRDLLKKQTSNLHLYNAYALVEYRLGNQARAEIAIVTSINMCKHSNESLHSQEYLLLWRTWTWELLCTGRMCDALACLLQYGVDEVHPFPHKTDHSEDQSAGPALLLRTEKDLTATRDQLLSLDLHAEAVLAMDLLILLTYLQSGLSFPSAVVTYQENIACLPLTASQSLETLRQYFARLIFHHTTHARVFSPSLVRSILIENISQFPNNTIFLSLYAWNEASFRIDDRVRSIVSNVVLSFQNPKKEPESVVSHYFATYVELHRSLTFGSNSSTIRSTFEHAVVSESGVHCAGLWKLYVLFEQSTGDIERAKAVFWRGLRACPWVKDLYLLAFDYLRDAMEHEELEGVYELLEQKGLRVHVELEDFLKLRAEKEGKRGSCVGEDLLRS